MFLTIDYGTSALKLAVMDFENNILFSAKEEYDYMLLPGEKAEIDTSVLITALEKVCQGIDGMIRKRIEFICYDTFSPSLVLMGRDGQALYPVVTHMDRRSRLQSECICNEMGKEAFQRITGVYPFAGGISLTTLLWFMKEMPDLCKKIYHIGHLPTFIHKYLTGEWTVDSVNASMTGLYDTVGESGWAKEILDTFHIPQHWLPPIHTPGEHLGCLLPNTANRLGLKTGIPVMVGTNDVVAAQAGANNTNAGQVLNISGSSDMISILVDCPAIAPGYYLRRAMRPGLWQIYATTSGGFTVEWFRKQFCREMDIATFYEKYMPICVMQWRDNPVIFDPYLSEDRQSLALKKGAFHMLSLGTTREHMLAAMLYAMQQVLADVLEMAATIVVMEKSIKVTGGLASEAIMQLKKEIFSGYKLEKHEDCTLRGNVALAKVFVQ